MMIVVNSKHNRQEGVVVGDILFVNEQVQIEGSSTRNRISRWLERKGVIENLATGWLGQCHYFESL
jgi:hypothetical protein